MSATLASIATDLETAAGASTSANPNESGYWKRIAAATEVLAGASTTANDNPQGYRLRAAVALESIAGTSGAEENANESGYKKRIVDALEVQAGAITAGSLDYRMMIAAAAAEFGDDFDGGLVLNGGFSNGDNWTLAGANLSIADGVLVRAGGAGTATASQTAAAEITGDTIYQATFDVVTRSSGTATISIGGANGTARSSVGTFVQFIKTAEPPSNQLFRFAINGFANLSVDNLNIIIPTETGLGAELCGNGGFDDDTGWTTGADMQIAAGKLVATAVAGTQSATRVADVPPVSGLVYRLTLTIDVISAGDVQLEFAGQLGAIHTAAGTFSSDIIATDVDDTISVTASDGTTATIDNVSAKEVLYT